MEKEDWIWWQTFRDNNKPYKFIIQQQVYYAKN
jgi:hypothetical protein